MEGTFFRFSKYLFAATIVFGGALFFISPANAELSTLIEQDETWTSGSEHLLWRSTVVTAGVTLTIEPGAIVKSTSMGALEVDGTLLARGTAENPITFTSWIDDSVGSDFNHDGSASAPADGDWGWVRFRAGSSGVLEHAVLRYGGSVFNLGSDAQVIAENASPTLRHLTIRNTYSVASPAVHLVNSAATLEDSDIAGNVPRYDLAVDWSIGIKVDGGNPRIMNNDFHHLGLYIISVHDDAAPIGPGFTVSGNRLYDSGATYYRMFKIYGGLINETDALIDVRNNWWGDDSGPKTASNEYAKGLTIIGPAQYDPWVGKPPRRPVLLIPGITGTELYNGNDKIWIDIPSVVLDQDDSFLDVLAMNKYGEPTQASVVPGDVLRVIGSSVPKFSYDYFGGLISELKTAGYEEGVDLFVFPYDWRRSIVSSSTLLAGAIKVVQKQTGTAIIDVVAHSMGGLVVERYVATHTNDSGIGKLIFIGTPHLGAPKAMKTLLWGDKLGIPLAINQTKIKEIVKNMFSMYELLPSQLYLSSIGSYYYDLRRGGAPNPLDIYEMRWLIERQGLNVFASDKAKYLLQSGLITRAFTTYGIEAYNIAGCNSPTITGIMERPNGQYYLRVGAGDETVPLESADYITSLVSKGYYIRDADHGKMSSQKPVRSLTRALIESGEVTVDDLPVGVTTAKDGCTVSGKLVSVHSPVSLDIFDAAGNHAGIVDGVVETSIPGVLYDTLGEEKFAFLPDGAYVVNLHGQGSGNFDLRIATYNSGEITRSVYYRDVPVLPTSNGTFALTQTSSDSEIVYDETGDGSFESVAAAAVAEGELVNDLTPPQTVAAISGQKGLRGWYRGPVTVALAASDDQAGVAHIEYKLNDEGWKMYSEQFVVSTDGEYSLEYRAVDKVGNDEAIQHLPFSIDTTPPNFSFTVTDPAVGFSIETFDNQSTPVVISDFNGYRITDEAGNSTNARIAVLTKKGKVTVMLQSVLYNGVEQLGKTVKAIFDWSFDKQGQLKTIKQQLVVPSSLRVNVNFGTQNDNTTLIIKEVGAKKVVEVVAGFKKLLVGFINSEVIYEIIE